MIKNFVFTLTFFMLSACYTMAFEKDTIKTNKGELAITFIGHGTLLFEFNGKTIHIDPVGNYADYSTLPKADLIFITHSHGDHLDIKAIEKIKKDNTKIIVSPDCVEKYAQGSVLKNGESGIFEGILAEAVPAYNIKNIRPNGKPYHPKGEGNGYIFTFGNRKVYVAGDTENIPEMKGLKDIYVAFLPMNLPYTMTPEMVADAVAMFKPEILYPYHFGNTKTETLTELLKNKPVDVRIRKMQ